jgi:hypothetical protein
MPTTLTFSLPGARSLTLERNEDGWWRCENPFGPDGPGFGRRLLIGRRPEGWVAGWEGEVYAGAQRFSTVAGALLFLVAPDNDPRLPWREELGRLIEENEPSP